MVMVLKTNNNITLFKIVSNLMGEGRNKANNKIAVVDAPIDLSL